VRVLARGAFQRGHDHVLDLIQQDRWRPSGPYLQSRSNPARLLQARVDGRARVCVRQNYYSAPARYSVRRLATRLSATAVEVLDGWLWNFISLLVEQLPNDISGVPLVSVRVEEVGPVGFA
jgi:hypothetical protein